LSSIALAKEDVVSDERVVDKVFRIWQLSILRNQNSFAGTHFPDKLEIEG